MYVKTDHREHFIAEMACEVCLVEARVSTFSPVFDQTVAVFMTQHSTCEAEGRPDFESAIRDFVRHRSEKPTHALLLDTLLGSRVHANGSTSSSGNHAAQSASTT